jgi:DNA-binding CsgD family transcriptional regulator
MADTAEPPHVAQLDELREVVVAARDGAGCPVLVSGRSGAGKTDLVHHACRQAEHEGMVVLWASCEAAPDAPGFWPWLQLLRQYMRHHAGDEFPVALQARMAEVIEMAPGVEQVMGGGAAPESLAVEKARFRLFDAVAQVLRGAGEVGPLVVVLDDLHAADEPSLTLLRHVAGELWGSRVALVAISRPVASRSAAALRETLQALGRARGARRLELAGGTTGQGSRAGELSPRESEVAALVAEGMSNREIGVRLSVSERTAENHVQNILNKLGFGTRAQIAAWFARHDRPPR